jgi:hypothetical protein
MEWTVSSAGSSNKGFSFQRPAKLTIVIAKAIASQDGNTEEMSLFSGSEYFRAAEFHVNVAVRTSQKTFPVEHAGKQGNWTSP